MKHLLDVNALIALAHQAHVHHTRLSRWYLSVKPTTTALCTCAITELGFVRVAVQIGLQSNVPTARKALARLKRSGQIPFELLDDALGVEHLPTFANTPKKITDGHLLQLAESHGAHLATLDSGIPKATLIPALEV